MLTTCDNMENWWTLFKKHTHTHTLAAWPASGQQHHVTTSPHFADEWLQQSLPADGRIDVDQHAEQDGGHQLAQSKKHPAGMHCTQQTTAQVTTGRRGGAQRHGRICGLLQKYRNKPKNIYNVILIRMFKYLFDWVQSLAENTSRPLKWGSLHFLLADLVGVFLAPHPPTFPLSLCRAQVKKQHWLNH